MLCKNLPQVLCQKSEPKLLPNSQPGVYQLDCSCNGKYLWIEKEGTYAMHRKSTEYHEWKMGIIWGCRTQKNIKDNSTGCIQKVCISPCMYERKILKTLEIKKLRKIDKRTKSSQFWIGTMVTMSRQILYLKLYLKT